MQSSSMLQSSTATSRSMQHVNIVSDGSFHRAAHQGTSSAHRTAFTLAPLHVRRDPHRITSIAVDPQTQRFFLGLSNGYVEEHALVAGPLGGTTAKLVSERKISRHPVSELCCLPVASRFVARSEDGVVTVASYESAQLYTLPGVRNVVAMAGDGLQRAPARLAVALKPSGTGSSKRSKLLVFAVASGPGGTTSGQPAQMLAQLEVQEPVLGMAWLGDSIVIEVPGGYKLARSGSRIADIAPNVTTHTRLAAHPAAKQALLLFSDSMVIAVDGSGSAVREPMTLTGPPLALAASDMFVVAVQEDGVHVMDRSTNQQVQYIYYNHDDAWVEANHRMPCAEDWHMGRVLLATSTGVMCLQPVALEAQAHELLKRKRYREVMDLVTACGGPEGGETWTAVALAQAGLMLLQDARFSEAVAALRQVPPAVLQPCTLLHLFPHHMARWLPLAPQRQLWGLHGALRDLDALCEEAAELHQATSPSSSSLATPSLATSPAASQASSASVASTSAAAAAVASQATVEALKSEAKHVVAEYLLEVRSRPGLQLADALDTLLVHLLAETQQAGALETLVGGGSQAALRDAVVALERAHRWHALALLRVAHNHSQEALDVWEGMWRGALQEAPASSGAVAAGGGAAAAAASVAASSAAQLMAQPAATTPAPLAVSKLGWLLEASPNGALAVLRARGDLPLPDVLALLVDREDDVRWQYLHHLVYAQGLSDSALHTELALELVDCLLREQQQQQQAAFGAGGAEGSAAGAASSSSAPVGTDGAAAVPAAAQAVPSPSRAPSLQQSLQSSQPQQQAAAGPSGQQQPAAASAAAITNWRLLLQRDRFPSHFAWLRAALQHHLQQSQLCDASIVLAAVAGSSLHAEQVALHQRLGDHASALRVLALVVGDVEGAIRYCKQYGGQQGWLTLLDLFLRPDEGREPMYSAAVRLLATEGAALQPQSVLQALPDDMPLHLAEETLSCMMASLLHRKRQGQVLRSLYRAQNLTVRYEHMVLASQSVTVTDDSACHGCHRLLGDRIFYRYPTGMLLCNRCVKPSAGDASSNTAATNNGGDT